MDLCRLMWLAFSSDSNPLWVSSGLSRRDSVRGYRLSQTMQVVIDGDVSPPVALAQRADTSVTAQNQCWFRLDLGASVQDTVVGQSSLAWGG